MAFFTLFVLFFSSAVQAQPCNQISFNFVHYEPCRFRLTYDNSTECYTQIRLALAQGEFVNWSANSNAGFVVEQISPSELWITNTGGFLPLGFQGPLIFTLPVDLVTTVSVAYLNDCPPGVGCELFPGPVLESCPDPSDGSISGVVYQECQPLPYTNQPPVPGWVVQLTDVDGNILFEQVTDADGNYAFFDLPVGVYHVKVVPKPGWTPIFPASGQVTIDITPSRQVVQNFGVCNFNCCATIQTNVKQISSSPGQCCYSFKYTSAVPACIQVFDIQVDAGLTISSYVAQPGWTVVQNGPQWIHITPPGTVGSVVPGGTVTPVTFCVTGGIFHHIFAGASYTDALGQHDCDKFFDFSCNGSSNACTCPNGGSPNATNLVVNGNFSGIGGFTSNYSPYVSPQPLSDGQYWVGSSANSVNPFFQNCVEHTGGVGNMLVANGSTLPNQKVWISTPITVTPNTVYKFGAWLASVSLTAFPAELQLYVNNVSVGNSFQVQPSPCHWEEYCESWFSGSSNTATLSLVDVSVVSTGNDFAVDDITLFECPGVTACKCKSPSTVTLVYDGQTQTLNCTQPFPPVLPCPTTAVTITSDFGCVGANGNPCPNPPPIDWILYGPNGIIGQGAATLGNPINYTFPAADFTSTGSYTMYMTTPCDPLQDSCKCVATWIQECMQPCTCGPDPFDIEIRFGGAQNQPVHCGEKLQIPTNGFFVLYPSFQCKGGNCSPPPYLVDWTLTGPSGFTTLNGQEMAMPAFSIAALASANFTIPGTYTLTMIGHCGGQLCPCTITFCLPPPDPFVNDQDVCRTDLTAYIPLIGCPTTCPISQVQWFVKPASASTWPTIPYQVSPSAPGANCSDLLLLPYQYAGEAFVQVYAELTLDGSCCVTKLTSNIATITLCDPISCTITNPNPTSYCQCGTPQALTLVPTNANCAYTVQWYYQGQPIGGAIGLSYQPPQLCFQPNAASDCYYDHVFTAIITGVCGTSNCSTTFRVYDPNAPVGTLDMVPFEAQPFCPGEDATLCYTPECAGDPAMWDWYYSTVSGAGPYLQKPEWGTMDKKINTNKLWQTTWYMVEKKNGVCPADQVKFKIEVKDQITIVDFKAIPDACIENYAVLTVDFTPSPIAGNGCSYVVDWYKDGNLIHTDIVGSSPVSYTYTGSGIPGVYAAEVRDNCCDQPVKTWPVILNPSCVPVILGPCYRCNNDPVNLTGLMILPPKDPCPNGVVCTYQWYYLDILQNPNVWVAISGATSSTLSVNFAGHFKLITICDYGYGPCTKEAYHDVAQCSSGAGGCKLVEAPEVTLPDKMKVEIHPNPTSGDMTVQIKPTALKRGRVEIVDVNGKVLFAEKMPENQSSHTMSLALLPRGIFFVRVYESDVLVWTGKVVRSE